LEEEEGLVTFPKIIVPSLFTIWILPIWQVMKWSASFYYFNVVGTCCYFMWVC
jgi:hypothetical protein